MAKLVAYLNAQPISTRFPIRVATGRAVHVMREPARINLPAGARRASTVKLAHLTVFGCLKARLPRPMRRRRCRRSPLFVRADEAIEIVERVIAGYGTTRISRSALDSRSTRCRRAITGARRYSHR
jgi:hypothetical protein